MKLWQFGALIAPILVVLGCSTDESTLADATWTNGQHSLQLMSDGTGRHGSIPIHWNVYPEEAVLEFSYDRTGNSVSLQYEISGGEFTVTDHGGWGDDTYLGTYRKRS